MVSWPNAVPSAVGKLVLPALGVEVQSQVSAAAGGLLLWGQGSGCALRGEPDPPEGPELLRHVPPASRVGDCKHGMMKFREERNLLGLGLSTGFHDRYFILNHSWLRLYKEVRVSPASRPSPSRCLPLLLPLPCHTVTLWRDSPRTWDPCGLAVQAAVGLPWHKQCRQPWAVWAVTELAPEVMSPRPGADPGAPGQCQG